MKNKGGRPEGKPNHRTMLIRAGFKGALIEYVRIDPNTGFSQMMLDLAEVSAKDRLTAMTNIAKIVMPRNIEVSQKANSAERDEFIRWKDEVRQISQMTGEEIKKEINRIENVIGIADEAIEVTGDSEGEGEK